MESAIKSILWDGQRISVPGIYANVSMEHYHRGDICDGPSISSSGLRMLWRSSPKHFWDSSPLNPFRCTDADDDNEDFLLGRAAHHLICGEAGFSARFVVRPATIFDPKEGKGGKHVAWNGNRLACRQWLATQKTLGKSVLKPDHIEIIRGMALELSKHPFARSAMSGLIERSMFWKDTETGVWLKARPDVIPTASGDYVDLKTTQSVLYVALQASLDTYGYHQQGALVLEGAHALGLPAESFSLMWVEKKRPYATRFLPVIEADLALGAKMNRVALRTFHDCFVKKSWPGPGEESEGADMLQLSDRARQRIEERLALQLKEAA